MKTIIKSDKNEVIISFDSPFTIIGEKINPTGRKKLAAAIKEGDYDYVKQSCQPPGGDRGRYPGYKCGCSGH